jgi:hypothetical protein
MALVSDPSNKEAYNNREELLRRHQKNRANRIFTIKGIYDIVVLR